MPTNADDVFFDAASGAVTVTVTATSVGLSLTFTGFTGTFAGSSGITISGNITLDAGMTLTYTGTLTINTTSTITSNTVIWSGNIGIGVAAGTFTVTLADDLYIAGTFTTVSTVQLTINGNNLYVAGNFSVPTGSTLVGTTGVILNTTTSQTLTTRTDIVNLRLDLTFNATGTIVLANNIRLGTGISTNKTITYIAGTMSMPANINIQVDAGRTINLDTSGMTWSSITVLSNGVFNLVSDLYLSGTLVTSTNSWSGSFTIYVGGGLTLTGTASAAASTTSIEMNGTGTISGSGGLRLNLIINTAGTITFSGTITYNTGTLTYTAGTVITTGSTLTIATTVAILNTAGIIWNNITISINGTTVNNSLLTISGTLTYSATSAITFGGTAGWTCGTFTCTVAGLTHTFTIGNTYTITSAFNITAATNASRITLRSSSGGTKVAFTLMPSATQNVGFVNATDLDSNAGQTIYSFNGVITTTFNWQTLTYPRQNNFVFQH